MAAIGWSEMMSVGVEVLDADHKTLIGLINDLNRSLGDEEEYATLGTVLKALEEYTEHHFAREERVMAACHYPALETHIRLHRHLSQQVHDFRVAYDGDRTTLRAKQCLDFLNQWLIEHICSADMDYRGWVVGMTPAQAAALENSDMTGPRHEALDWSSKRVLVVDDNVNFCQVVCTILAGVGLEKVVVAHSIEAAMTELRGVVPDVMIADWHIGVGNGLDLVTWARHQPSLVGLPVLVLSGREGVASREAALTAGADDFMEKPVSARGLLICLGRLLRRER